MRGIFCALHSSVFELTRETKSSAVISASLARCSTIRHPPPATVRSASACISEDSSIRGRKKISEVHFNFSEICRVRLSASSRSIRSEAAWIHSRPNSLASSSLHSRGSPILAHSPQFPERITKSPRKLFTPIYRSSTPNSSSNSLRLSLRMIRACREGSGAIMFGRFRSRCCGF